MRTHKLAAPSRRSVLGAGVAALAGRLPVIAADSADRVLVCIYLFGGNDSNNMIVPLDHYSSYRSARGRLAVSRDSLLPVRAIQSQEMYGFHPALSELRDVFESRALAVVSNVGRQADSDQADQSLAYLPDGFAAPAWAIALGRATGVFTRFAPASQHNTRGGTSLVSPGGPSGKELAQVVESSLHSELSLQTQFPESGLGSQLRQIAKVIALSSLKQQVYLCPLTGSATGGDQLSRQEALFRELSPAMAAFYRATVELGIDRRVTAYTDTEFNRTLVANRNSGTGHGWGGRHLALGGSVAGGSVYGRFPGDATETGVTPGISSEQYSATFAKWMGVDASSLKRLFPELLGAAGTLEFLS